MPSRVSNAVFAYVHDFIAILDSDYFAQQVATALETKILSIIDWDIIPKVLLIDEIVTLVRREPPGVRMLMVKTLDMAFARLCSYRRIFTALVDRSIGPEFLYGLPVCQEEPLGPREEPMASV